ncbi:MAG: ankyrin repeat domain-containing protein [Alphaproteobacteria bacterium]|nr:ankyrin repeat domain-containing protein [Alphaproteobacteria bacterium]
MKKIICLASLAVMTASVWGMPFDNLRENRRNRDAVLPQQEVRNEEQTLNNNQFNKKNENNKRLIVATKLPGKLGIDKMKELLEDGADPNFEFNGDTPLSVALKAENVDKIDLLLNFGVSLELLAIDTRLWFAVKRSDVDEMRRCLSQGADPDYMYSGKTVLSVASQVKKQDILKELEEIKKKREQVMIAIESCKKNKKTRDILKNALKALGNPNFFIGKSTTPLMYAVGVKNPLAVNTILELEGIDINKKDEYGNTALAKAAGSYSFESAKCLLRAGADVNSQNVHGETPLLYAVDKEDKRMVNLLLNNGADVNLKRNDDRLILEIAAELSRFDSIDVLFENPNCKINLKGININKKDKDGNTALARAVYLGRVKTAEYLLRAGADVNSQNVHGETPLHFAAYKGNAEMVNLLLENRADINLKQNNGCSSFRIGVERNHFDVVDALLKNSDCEINDTDKNGNTPLLSAASEGLVEMVKKLLSAEGIKTDIKNNKGQNVLTIAVQNDRVEVVELLLNEVFDAKVMNDVDSGGYSLIHRVVVEKYSDLLDLLLGYKDNEGKMIANINAQDGYGLTPLAYAVRDNSIEIANKLLDYDHINLTKKDKHGQTVLLYAVANKNADIAEKILEKIPEKKREKYINIKSSLGTSALNYIIQNNDRNMLNLFLDYSMDQVDALFFATIYRNSEMVKLLTDRGVNVNAKSEEMPVLACAAALGYTEIVKLLLDAGANVNTATKEGETALDIVKKLKNRDEVIRLLEKAAGISESEERRVKQLGLSAEEINSRFVSALTDTFAEKTPEENLKELLEQYDVNGKRMVTDESINQIFLEISKKGYAGMLDLLLPYVEDLNVQDRNGNTALMLAVEYGHDMLVQILLNYYVKTNENQYVRINTEIANNDNKTALMLAVDKKNKNIVKILQNSGAKVFPSNSEKKYKREAIKELLNEEKGQNQQNEMILLTGFPVYAGNTFCKQLEELDDNLKKKVREIIQRIRENPYYVPERDENFELLDYGCYSRRLNDKHRFIYRVLGGVVQCLFCKDHNTKLERLDKVAISGMVCKYRWEQNGNGESNFVWLDREDRGRLSNIANN